MPLAVTPGEGGVLATMHAPRVALRAAFRPDTADSERRTVTVVAATGNPVLMNSWEIGDYYEALSMDPAHVRLSRLNAGAPLLNSHGIAQRYGLPPGGGPLENQIGVVERAWLENEELLAELRFSLREDVTRIWEDVEAGIYRNTSIRYDRFAARDITEPEDKIPRVLLIDWEPSEVSLTPIPADHHAGVRSHGGQTTRYIIFRGSSMPPDDNPQPNPQHAAPPAEPEVRSGGHSSQPQNTPASPPADPAPPAGVQPQPSRDPDAMRAEIRREERQRCSDIRSAVRAANLDPDFADTLIEEGLTTDAARSRIFDRLAERQQHDESRSRHRADVNQEEGETTVRGMEAALLHRANPEAFPLSDERAVGRQFRGLSLMEMSRELLRMRGVDIDGWDRDRIAVRSFAGASDFPKLLENITTKTLLAAYEAEMRTFTPIAVLRTPPDFKQNSEVRVSDAPALEKVGANGEVRHGVFGEAREKWALATYAKNVSFTRQMLINDDLGVFVNVPAMFGGAAARTENDVFWALITGNVVLEDGVALFDNAHNNLVTGTLGITGMGNAQKALRTQTDINGSKLNWGVKTIMVPAALEVSAYQLLEQITPAEVAKANVFRNAIENVVVESRLDAASATQWYAAAGKTQAPGAVYGYLDGQTGPKAARYESADVLGVTVQIYHDFGAGIVDFRPFVRSSGV